MTVWTAKDEARSPLFCPPIPYNETNKDDQFHRSSGNRVHNFLDYLMKGGVTATIRKEFGSDIDAACGQLRAKVEGASQ